MKKKAILIITTSVGIALPLFVFLGLGISLGSGVSGIENISTNEIDKDTYQIRLDFCRNDENSGSLGVVVKTDSELIPIPISEKLSNNKCQNYGTKIHTQDISSLSFSLFSTSDIQDIIQNLEKQKYTIENDLVKTEQDIIKLLEIDPENQKEIDKVRDNKRILQEILESTKNSIKSMVGLL